MKIYGKKDYWNSFSNYASATGVDMLSNFFRDGMEREHIKSVLGFRSDMRVLDLGCGNGSKTIIFKDCNEVIGIDSSKNFIEEAKSRYKFDNITFLVGDCLDFNVSGRFDIIYLGGLLPCIDEEDCKVLIDRLKLLLKDDGVILTRNPIFISSESKRVHIRTKKEIMDLFCGMECVYDNVSTVPQYILKKMYILPKWLLKIVLSCIIFLEPVLVKISFLKKIQRKSMSSESRYYIFKF